MGKLTKENLYEKMTAFEKYVHTTGAIEAVSSLMVAINETMGPEDKFGKMELVLLCAAFIENRKVEANEYREQALKEGGLTEEDLDLKLH